MVAALIGATGSRAATMTVGPHLPMDIVENVIIGCTGSCAFTNPTAPDGGSHLAPTDGVILRWSLYRGTAASPESPHPGYRLRVLTPFAGGYLAAGTSAWVVPARFERVETFSTRLPVRAGQVVALEMNGDSHLRFGFSLAATSVFLEPAPADGESASGAPGWEDGYVFPFNADVLPSPRIDGLSPSSGSLAGGTKVTLTGDNFAEVASVEIGGQPVEFTVDSESQLSVVVPPWPQVGPVAVRVVTAAGSAEAASGYRYEGYVVPKLKGKALKVARKALGRRQCKLGEVRKRHGATTKTGRVKRQAPPRGTVLKPDAEVEVALGLNPKPHR
jgi:IPT/TIG domain